MRRLLHPLLVGVVIWSVVSSAAAQGLADEPPSAVPSSNSGAESLALEVDRQRQQIETLEKTLQALAEQLKSAQPGATAAAAGLQQTAALEEHSLHQKAGESAVGQDLETYRRELDELRQQQLPAGSPADIERLRKQVELQRKQMDVLEKMVRLLIEQLKKLAPSADVQTPLALLEARCQQAARRDQQVASALDDLNERIDAAQRQEPRLPPTLRELFHPGRTNESPLAIYGTLAADFQDFQEQNSNFPSPVFSTHLYLLLNEQFLLEANPEFRGAGVKLESAQLDWFLHDHLTLVVGLFYSPLGFFNERLHTSWIFKTPDRPLVFQQVLPEPLSFTGAQLRGATYLGDWPVKLEYSTLIANGFSLPTATPRPRDFADLRAMKEGFDDVNNGKALGGRVGLSIPPLGVVVGLSGLANGAYDRGGQHDLNIWDVDAGCHYGNWEVRFEYAHANQQAPTGPIHRRGFYTQLAYRPYDSCDLLLRRLEGVVRYDHVEFDGINLAVTGLDFGPRERIPVNRHRYTFGINFYPYESLIFKLAYQISDEWNFREINDNGFLAQVAWGF